MGILNDKWGPFESRWRGEINHSTMVITKKTVNRKRRYDLVNKTSYGVYAILGIWVLLEINKGLQGANNGLSIEVLIPLAVFVAAAAMLQQLVNIYKAPYYKIKALLMNHAQSEFCNCANELWGYSCMKNHKEIFLKDVKDTFDLNLYY